MLFFLTLVAVICSSWTIKAQDVGEDLVELLSPNATVSSAADTPPRFSDYNAPRPGIIVNVATEEDVRVTVQYCVEKDIPFLAQNGGHGWIRTFNLKRNGLLINLRGLNKVSINAERTEAVIQGGANIKEVIDAAWASDAQVLTGGCNCVGALGAGLGGGYGPLMGLHGLSIDNMLALNTVLANGSLVTVTPNDTDLWWALRGAGPNFGIVTSAVLKAYPVPQAESKAWQGALIFSEDKIEAIAQAIEEFKLAPEMYLFLFFVTSGPPDFTPAVVVAPFLYGGTVDEGKKAFASIYALEPVADLTAEVPYNRWNDGADRFCITGGFRPNTGVGFSTVVPKTWRSIWNQYTDFLKNNGTESSSVIIEGYSIGKTQSIDSASSSFPGRDIRFNAVISPSYADRRLERKAKAFASNVRRELRADDGFPRPRTYINFASGDEQNEVVYGSSLKRLRKLKREYDPENVFNQWFNLS